MTEVELKEEMGNLMLGYFNQDSEDLKTGIANLIEDLGGHKSSSLSVVKIIDMFLDLNMSDEDKVNFLQENSDIDLKIETNDNPLNWLLSVKNEIVNSIVE